jgi:carbonyl reductase 1
MRVLVTGATRGIGLAIVEALASEGGRNAIYLGCRDARHGQDLSYMLAGRHALPPGIILPVILDVTDAESIAAAVANVAADGHKLDALVNNAGVLLERDGLCDLNELIEPTLSVNIDGVVTVTTAFMGMLRDGGQIINISSGAGTRTTGALAAAALADLENATTPAALRAAITRLAHDVASRPHATGETPIYGLSKCALNFYTQLIARQVPRLRVNACSPGFCRTDIAGKSVAYTREPKDAALGASVVLKLLREELTGSGCFFKESSKPGTPLEAAMSVAEPWIAREGGEKAATAPIQPPPPTSNVGTGKRKVSGANEGSPQTMLPPNVKQDLVARVVAAIKSTEHTERGRPFTIVEVPMPLDEAAALLPGLQKCSYDGAAAVLTFLPLPKTVHPVKSRVSTLCVDDDDDGFVYSWAGYESLEASYVKSSQMLKLKVRTLYLGSGMPEGFRLGSKHYDGYVVCKTLPELRRWIQDKELDSDE